MKRTLHKSAADIILCCMTKDAVVLCTETYYTFLLNVYLCKVSLVTVMYNDTYILTFVLSHSATTIRFFFEAGGHNFSIILGRTGNFHS